jgi:hypothetical protein
VYSGLQDIFKDVSRGISEKWQVIWQFPGRSILTKFLISMLWIITIPVLFALVPLILLILVVFITGLFLYVRWLTIVGDVVMINTGDMKVPTFYSSRPADDINGAAYIIMMSVVGVVFGGIHCIGWFFIFPSSDEATLWRVSSAVLTGIAFLFPLLAFLAKISDDHSQWGHDFLLRLYVIFLLVYVVSRLNLLVEAFISFRHLTPGMLALVKWTSFIPHI